MSVPSMDDDFIYSDATIGDEDMFATGGASQLSIFNSEVLQTHIMQFVDEVIDDNLALTTLSQETLPDIKLSLPSALNPTGKYPSADEFCHEDVSCTVVPSSKQGSGFIYSQQLQKMYLKTDSICSFDVKCELLGSSLTPRDWSVRVMLVSLAPESQHEPIMRCHNHLAKDNGPERVKKYVVRCKNVQHEYVGEANGPFFEDRCAVLVPLDPDELSVKIMLQFVCQNTCFNVNQRRTALVFTLENSEGLVWARRVVQVKVCINYRRDMQNEENATRNSTTNLSCLAGPSSTGSNGAMTMARRRNKTSFTRKRRQPVVKVEGTAGSGPKVMRTTATTTASFQPLPSFEPCLVEFEMPNIRMAKRVMDNAIGMLSMQVLRVQGDRYTTDKLMEYINNIRTKRDMLTAYNSQCSVDSDLLNI
ncbi:uncharacterized protein LOC126566703 [Anopheles maculipalpis]|uniref:uncharacterized protein LOC126566703 n=1 Tax=Anopheles maculipalpis TaxID=1496333 RepID=UPI002159590C|nr:uncharacterized protein LOC126566703 [Anopheles maculipalpis]